MEYDNQPTSMVSGTLTFEVLHSGASYGDTDLAWDLLRMVYSSLAYADLPANEIVRFCWVPDSVENLADPPPDPEDDPAGYYQDGKDYSNHAAFKGAFCAEIVGTRGANDVHALLLDWLSELYDDPPDLEVSSITPFDTALSHLLGDRAAALLERPEVSEVAKLAVQTYVKAMRDDW